MRRRKIGRTRKSASTLCCGLRYLSTWASNDPGGFICIFLRLCHFLCSVASPFSCVAKIFEALKIRVCWNARYVPQWSPITLLFLASFPRAYKLGNPFIRLVEIATILRHVPLCFWHLISGPMRLIALAFILFWYFYFLFFWLESFSGYSLIETKRTLQVWKKPLITWTFSDPHKLVHSETTKSLLRSLLNTSFTLWENALGRKLKIVEVNSLPADMEIYFARKNHGDKEVPKRMYNEKTFQALDGPGGMVAHSGLPPRGYLHLDADEKWSFDGETGIDLRYVNSRRDRYMTYKLQVILHETGHLLGLRHIWKRKSIMNPYYR